MPKTRREYVSVVDEDGNRFGGTGVDISEQCLTCVHKERNLSCAAFEVIPEEILNGSHDHRTPYPGDGGYRYEKHPRVAAPPRSDTAMPSRARVRALRNARRRIRKQIAGKVTETP
jgi:hypothetical protein